MDDRFLIRQVLAGHRNAFRLLVARYQRPVFRFLGGFGLTAAVAEEIAQEAFLRAYRNLAAYDGERGSFASWLLTITRNLALHEVERAGHRKEAAGGGADELPARGTREDDAGAHAVIEAAERHGRLRGALAKLPVALRSALVLAYVRELSLDEIAAIERCPVGTIKSRIFRGKQLLRAALAKTET